MNRAASACIRVAALNRFDWKLYRKNRLRSHVDDGKARGSDQAIGRFFCGLSFSREKYSVWQTIKFLWLCIRKAARGSIEPANAWAWLGGTIIIGGGSYLLGYDLTIPHTWWGLLSGGLMFIGSTWIVVFIYRLFLAPGALYFGLHKQVAAKYTKLEIFRKLEELYKEGEQLSLANENLDGWATNVAKFLNDSGLLDEAFMFKSYPSEKLGKLRLILGRAAKAASNVSLNE
jgi:hypothetical protein